MLYGKAALALLFVCGLIGLLSFALRRLQSRSIGWRNTSSAEQARLAITERLVIDATHEVFILTRDDVQHLILKTPHGSQVIESGFSAKPRTLKEVA